MLSTKTKIKLKKQILFIQAWDSSVSNLGRETSSSKSSLWSWETFTSQKTATWTSLHWGRSFWKPPPTPHETGEEGDSPEWGSQRWGALLTVLQLVTGPGLEPKTHSSFQPASTFQACHSGWGRVARRSGVKRMTKVLHGTPGMQKFRKTGAMTWMLEARAPPRPGINQGKPLTSLLESFQNSHPRSLWSFAWSPRERKPDPFAFSFGTPSPHQMSSCLVKGLVQGAP